jgi:hypothetical protein
VQLPSPFLGVAEEKMARGTLIDAAIDGYERRQGYTEHAGVDGEVQYSRELALKTICKSVRTMEAGNDEFVCHRPRTEARKTIMMEALVGALARPLTPRGRGQ